MVRVYSKQTDKLQSQLCGVEEKLETPRRKQISQSYVCLFGLPFTGSYVKHWFVSGYIYIITCVTIQSRLQTSGSKT